MGGANLTGYGILQWEKPGERPDDSEAVAVGADVRSKTFSGLKYGRSQGFEIRACNGDNRCSAWASLTVPAMAGLLPTIALPKTTIKIGEQISVGANDVPVGAVAYLQLEGPIQPRGRARTRAPQFGDDVGIEEIHALVELRGGTATEGPTRGCESFGARLGREQQRLEVWLRRWLRLRFGVGVQFP